MSHVDIIETKRVRREDDIAAGLMIFKLTVTFERHFPDCSPRGVGNKEIAFSIESQTIGHKGLRPRAVRSCSGYVNLPGRQSPGVSTDGGDAAAKYLPGTEA